MAEETPPPAPPAHNRIPTNIADEMRQSYMDYAMSVIIGRALPDVRDGLKPANRRVLYGMQQMGLQPGRPPRKCAKIVGEVMGNYHPHGDQAIYDTLVRMAQPFNMRGMLVDGQGNFGSVDGDPPAAQRYTEARLTRLGASMMEDIEKDTVDYQPTYDDSSVGADGAADGAARTCSSTARPGSRSAWPPTSRPTTWARWWTPSLSCSRTRT